MRFEIVPLVVNVCGFVFYLVRWQGPGKVLYWLGASILTGGLLLMKG
jgi:hypothetical protein